SIREMVAREIRDVRREIGNERDDPDPHVQPEKTASTLSLYEPLMDFIPSMRTKDFYDLQPSGEKPYDINDYYKTQGMSYTGPPLSDLPVRQKLSQTAQAVDRDLRHIQALLATSTRPLDTFARDIYQLSEGDPSDLVLEVLAVLNTFRYMSSEIATHITQLRARYAYKGIGYSVPATSSNSEAKPVLTMEAFAEAKKFTEATKYLNTPISKETFIKDVTNGSRTTIIIDATITTRDIGIGHPITSNNHQIAHVNVRHRAHATAHRAQAGTITATGAALAMTTREKDREGSRETSRWTTSPLSTSMASTVRFRMGKFSYRSRLQGSLPYNTADPPTTSDDSAHVQSGEIGDRKRSTSVITQESHRGGIGTRILQSPIHHPQENRRSPTSFKSQATKSVYSALLFQNGDAPTNLPPNKERLFHDLYRPQRCLPSCTDPPLIQEVSEVSMAGTVLPVQNPAIRSVTFAPGIHQDPKASITVGPPKRYNHLSVFRRSANRSLYQGTNSRAHPYGTQEANGTRISGQGIQVQPRAKPTYRPLRLHYRYHDNVALGAKRQSTRSEERSVQASLQDFSSTSQHLSINWQGNGNDNSSFPGQDHDAVTDPTDQQSTEDRMQLDGDDYHQPTSPGGISMVENSLVTVERPVVHPPDNGSRRVHGFVGQPLGVGDQRDDTQRDLVTKGSHGAYQLEGVEMHLACSQSSSVTGPDSQHNFRQHDGDIVHQQIWRHQIGPAIGSCNQNLEILPSDRDEVENDLCSLSLQPGGRPLAADDDSAGMVHSPELLSQAGSIVGPTPHRPLRFTQEQEASTLHLLEAPSDGIQDRSTPTSMELVGPIVDLSSMESNSSGSSSDSRGKASSNSDHTALGGSTLVPDSQVDGCLSSGDGTTTHGSDKTQRSRSCTQSESILVSERVEHRRRKLVDASASNNVTTIMFESTTMKQRFQRQDLIQRAFVNWTKENGQDPWIPNAITIMNYLAYGCRESGWAVATIQNYRSHILQLYDDPSVITEDPRYTSFMKAVTATGVKRMRNIDIDITP
ncbi:hypothetical protein BGX26_005826, partial [Mortierella sp. AD094]